MRALGTIATVVTGMLVCGPSAYAQDGPSRFLHVVTITVQPGTSQTWADYRMRVNEAAERVGDRRTQSVITPVLGGSPNRFRIVTPFNDYSEVESWQGPRALLAEAFGAEEAARIAAPVEGIMTAVDITVRQFQPNLSGTPDAVTTGQCLQLVTTTVDPSRSSDYVAFVSAVKAAEDRRGISRQRRTNAMGTSFTYTTSWLFDSMAGREIPGPGPLLTEDLGEDVAQSILDRANEAVESRTFEIWRFRDDLGRNPG